MAKIKALTLKDLILIEAEEQKGVKLWRKGSMAQLAKEVDPFMPKLQLPEASCDKYQWNIGHKCLKYLDKVLPSEKIFSASLASLVMRKIIAQEVSDSSKAPDWFIFAIAGFFKVGMFLDALRETKSSELLNGIKKLHVANCPEYATVTAMWLIKHNCRATQTLMRYTDKKHKSVSDCHEFVLYSLDGRSFEECVKDLNNPNVWIVDLWARKCAPASKMMNEYTGFFSEGGPLEPFQPIQTKRRVVLQAKRFIDDSLTRLEESLISYDVGCVKKGEDGANAMQFETARSFSITPVNLINIVNKNQKD